MSMRFALVAGVVAASTAATAHAGAREPRCAAGPAADRLATRDETLRAARSAVHPADRPRGRALYLALLAHDPEDDEATIGLAELDAQDGCTSLAERDLRELLARVPNHVAGRVALSDLLFASGRWSEAERVLDEGLARMPIAPELLYRRGRLRNFRGDARGAARDLDEGLRVVPSDVEMREARDRVTLGQVRIGQRLQLFPKGYDDVAITDVSAMQRIERWRVEIGFAVASRAGGERPTRTGPRATRVVDGRPSLGLYRHLPNGAWIGASYGFATPALSLPEHAFAASGMTPIGARFSAAATAAYWLYADSREVVILSPALGVTLTDRWDLTGRYWSTTVMVPQRDPTTVHSLGLRAGFRVDATWTFGFDYTYGVQLERLPGVAELLDLRSHVVTLLGRRLFTRTLGVDAALGIERRESAKSGAAVLGPTIEVGLFARW